MRSICFFVGTSLSRNAVSTHFQALSKELVQRGHRVVILAPPGEFDPSPEFAGPELVAWWSARPTHTVDAFRLLQLINKYHPDCLIANFAPVNWMCIVGWLRRVPCRIAWYHTLSTQIDMDWRKPGYLLPLLRLRKRLVYRSATHIATNSQAGLEDIGRSYGVSSDKCKIWRNSLPDPVSNMEITCGGGRENMIVCAGRFHKTKGQDILIRALAQCRHELGPTRIEFLGEGPTLDAIRGLASELQLSPQVVFRGNVSQNEVLAVMARAMFTVVPSRAEAFGLVNIESMSVATPVVASMVGGIPQIIRDRIDGFLVPPDDPQALAGRMSLLLGDGALRRKMGENARKRFLETFEQNVVVRAQADWLERVSIAKDHDPNAAECCVIASAGN